MAVDKKILDSIIEQIGDTPMVRLNRIPQSLGIEATVCKFSMNIT
jgi:cystathionine beta-synthase